MPAALDLPLWRRRRSAFAAIAAVGTSIIVFQVLRSGGSEAAFAVQPRRSRSPSSVDAASKTPRPVADEVRTTGKHGAHFSPADLGNAGTATPEACLETLIWATSHGEVAALANAVVVSPEGQSTIDLFLNRLPPEERASYPSARLVALLWTGEWTGEGELSACHVSEVDRREDGALSFGLDWVFASGRVRRSTMTLVHRADGWRQIVSPIFVEGLVTSHLAGTGLAIR